MSATPRLSAILITRDEAIDLPDCLASLGFCDEIVVVDSGSTDATIAIARAAGATVVVTDEWPGFGAQKQRALDLATGDFVLSIDADERIPAALAEEIRAAISRGDRAGWRINRRSSFLGRFLLHGGWYPDRILRLAKREAARFTPDRVHERLEVAGAVGDLSADMIHHSYRSIDEVLDKGRRYGLAAAAERRARGKRGGLFVAILRAKWAFLRHYVLQAGFLDGAHGFVAALAKAQETFWRWLAVGWET
ncbi:MAG: glycosyltransferase family 2 protein [Phyllobacteriaceae bacterium]|nr:glycosyltransferase family 2 protein [Phyllobacteriaceae bacterium]